MKKIIKNLLRRGGYAINSVKDHPDPFLDQLKLIGKGSSTIIFDVGAHHGQTALKYQQIFRDCIIYSFEPFLESYILFNNNVKDFKNVKGFNIALGNSIGEENFYINKFSATNSLLPTHKEGAAIWGNDQLENVKTIKVSTTTLDEFVKQHKIEKIDILKLDTQGTEYLVIEGARQAIQEGKIKLIYLEIITKPTYVNQKYLDEMLQLLRVERFQLYNIYNHSLTDAGELRQVDALFIHQSFGS